MRTSIKRASLLFDVFNVVCLSACPLSAPVGEVCPQLVEMLWISEDTPGSDYLTRAQDSPFLFKSPKKQKETHMYPSDKCQPTVKAATSRIICPGSKTYDSRFKKHPISKYLSNEKKKPGCLGYIGDETLPSYMCHGQKSLDWGWSSHL